MYNNDRILMLNVNTPILGECAQSAICKFIIMPAEKYLVFFFETYSYNIAYFRNILTFLE
jgi:hypothetical protein